MHKYVLVHCTVGGMHQEDRCHFVPINQSHGNELTFMPDRDYPAIYLHGCNSSYSIALFIGDNINGYISSYNEDLGYYHCDLTMLNTVASDKNYTIFISGAVYENQIGIYSVTLSCHDSFTLPPTSSPSSDTIGCGDTKFGEREPYQAVEYIFTADADYDEVYLEGCESVHDISLEIRDINYTLIKAADDVNNHGIPIEDCAGMGFAGDITIPSSVLKGELYRFIIKGYMDDHGYYNVQLFCNSAPSMTPTTSPSLSESINAQSEDSLPHYSVYLFMGFGILGCCIICLFGVILCLWRRVHSHRANGRDLPKKASMQLAVSVPSNSMAKQNNQENQDERIALKDRYSNAPIAGPGNDNGNEEESRSDEPPPLPQFKSFGSEGKEGNAQERIEFANMDSNKSLEDMYDDSDDYKHRDGRRETHHLEDVNSNKSDDMYMNGDDYKGDYKQTGSNRVSDVTNQTPSDGDIDGPHQIAVTNSLHVEDFVTEKDELKMWLTDTVQLPQYLHIFIENGYDTMKFLHEIDDISELEEIGITNEKHRRIIFSAIRVDSDRIDLASINSYAL